MDTNHTVKLNNNSYLSIGIVVLIIVATLWIKDGQARNVTENQKVASDLAHYKELQAKDAQMVITRLEALTELVKAQGQDRWTGKDTKRVWIEFQRLNPALKLVIPDFP